MISKIIAKGFKGFTGEQHLEDRTIFIGPNGAGKTCRSQALQLAVNGYVIGAGKKNEEILSTFGEGDKLAVGVQIDGRSTFARQYSRNAEGKVSQKYYVENAPVAKDFFMKALGEAGAPVVLNVADFMDLSDQKKIEALFQLYPPAGDVNAVQGKIDAVKEKINALNQKIKTTEQAAARIASSKSEIKIPAGTLAEVDAEIEAKNGELAGARNELMEIKIAEQKAESERKAKEEAERKEKERLEAEAAQKEKDRITAEEKAKELAARANEQLKPKITDEEALEAATQKPGPEEQKIIDKFGNKPAFTLAPVAQIADAVCSDAAVKSITAIINALESAGCGQCAARMVAKRELKKYTGGEM